MTGECDLHGEVTRLVYREAMLLGEPAALGALEPRA